MKTIAELIEDVERCGKIDARGTPELLRLAHALANDGAVVHDVESFLGCLIYARLPKPDEPAPPAKIGDLTDWIVAAASPAFAWIGPNRVSPTEPPPPADPEPPAQSWRDRPPLL